MPPRPLALLASALLAAAAAPAPALAGLEPAVSTFGFTCPSAGTFEVDGTPLTREATRPLLGLSAKSGSVGLVGDPLAAGDRAWISTQGLLPAGAEPTFDVACVDAGAQLDGSVHDRPTPPFSLSGRGHRSSVSFLQGRGTWSADVISLDGPAQAGFDGVLTTMQGARTFPLGNQPATRHFDIEPPRGGTWSLDVGASSAATTPTITLRGAKPAFVRPGGTVELDLAASEPVGLDLVLSRGPGRERVATIRLAPGQRSFVLPPVPDGLLTARAQSLDGQVSSTPAFFTVDSVAPRVTLTVPRLVGPATTFRPFVSDFNPAAGFAGPVTTRVSDPRQAVALDQTWPDPAGVIRPLVAWQPGRHDLAMTATDGAGNATTITRSFTAVKPEPCSKAVAAQRLERARARRPRITRVLCRDVDRDGIKEMVAAGTRARRTVLAAFLPSDTGWRVALRRAGVQVTRLSADRRGFVVRRAGGRALQLRVTSDGQRFVAR